MRAFNSLKGRLNHDDDLRNNSIDFYIFSYPGETKPDKKSGIVAV
jgi:hypothetical protein